MNRVLSVIVGLFGLARCLAAQAPLHAPMDVRVVALRIVELETRRQEAGAAVTTIDTLLALYSDSAVYEHPTLSVVVRGKANLRRSMVDYIGSIRNVAAAPPRVMVGNRVAVVETSAQMEVRDEGRWIPVSRHGIRVIEFEVDGLVRRIIDYPW